MIEEPYTDETPLTILMDKEEPYTLPTFEEAYRQASREALRVLQQAIEFITEAPSPDLAAYGVAYSLNTSVVNQSMRKRCEELGYSHNAISAYASQFKKIINLQ